MRQFNTLTGFLVSKSTSPSTDDTVEFQGQLAIGDGGSTVWKHNGVTAQTPSQSPTQLSANLLNDASGNQWALVFGQVVNYDGNQWFPLPFGKDGIGSYLYDENGWGKVALDLINDLSQEFALDTYTELTSGAIVFPVGKKIRIKERNDALFIFNVGGASNDSYILDAGNGNTAVLSVDSTSNIVSFGAIDELASGIDNSVNINFSINILKRLIMPIGDFEIHNPVLIPVTTYGYVWEGHGMEKSILRAVGMTGKNGIELASIAIGPRVQMRDFQVIGDCDIALNLDTTGTGSEIQMGHFENMRLTSRLTAMYAPKYFSCSWYNVHTETTVDGHGFHLTGGNSTVLINCYAHNIAGAGKAGYRIEGKADLIGCNGVDSGERWGIFGADIAQGDPVQVLYRINLNGGNAEDFTDIAIETRASGSIYLNNFNMIPPAVGVSATFQSYVQMNCASSTLVRNGGAWTSKGAVRQALADIETPNNQYYIEVVSSDQPEPVYEKTGGGPGLYSAGVRRFSTPNTTTRATYLGNIDCSRNFGFNAETPIISVDVGNIDVTGVTKVITQNTVATFVDSATGFVRGQSLYVMVNDSNTTIRHLAAGAGRFDLTGGVNIVANQGDVFEFVTFDGVEWNQVK